MSAFSFISLTGADTDKFLQGQLTIDTQKLTQTPVPCAISDLKGRVHFGLWAARIPANNDEAEQFWLITAEDCMAELTTHIKKYGAFSKFSTSAPCPIYPCVNGGLPVFSQNMAELDFEGWASASIACGNYWITKASQGLFQPQELRLHQRGGVDYDKGCYLGQEIIARLYFKASPKAYLHRVRMDLAKHATTADDLHIGDKIDKVQIVNFITHPSTKQHEVSTQAVSTQIEALVIGTPEQVATVGEVLSLPEALMGSVARQA